MNLTTWLAHRFLKSPQKFFAGPLFLVAVGGIVFSVMATLVSWSVLLGVHQVYTRSILAFNAHLIVIRDGEIEDEGDVLDVLRRSKDLPIKAVTPFVFREGLGVVDGELAHLVVKGVESEKISRVYGLTYRALDGKEVKPEELFVATENPSSPPPVLLGKDLLGKFFPHGVPPHPQIRVLLPKTGAVQKNVKDYTQWFSVAGTFESGFYEFDSQFLLGSLPRLQNLFHLGKQVSGFEISIADILQAPKMARALERELPSGYQVISWDEFNAPFFEAMKMEKTVFLVIMSLVLSIAFFNISGVILMLILNRRGDIAMLRTMGASVGLMARVFSLQGLWVGGLGVLGGALAAFLLLKSLTAFHWFELDPQIYFISELPVLWSAGLWVTVLVFTFCFSYAVSWITSLLVMRRLSVVKTFR